MRDDSRFLRHTSTALFTDPSTGQQVAVDVDIYSDHDSAWAILRCDGRVGEFPMPLAEVLWWRAFLFPDSSPGLTAPVPPVVNLDGTPRNKLRDRISQRRARTDPEATAAD